jgi:HSP20 family protein
MTLVRWNPARDLAAMEIDRLDRMFNDLFSGGSQSWLPAVDIYENANHEFVLEAELPALKREDIDVTFENNVLTVRAERRAEREETVDRVYRRERQHGVFSRSFTLPATVDPSKIAASYKDGLLKVRVPQREEARPKQITIEG